MSNGGGGGAAAAVETSAGPASVEAARAAAKAIGAERDGLVHKLQASQDILATVRVALYILYLR